MDLVDTDSLFSELMLLQSKGSLNEFDLRMDGPGMNVIHPQVLRSLLVYLADSSAKPRQVLIPGWNYQIFTNLDDLRAEYESVTLQKGEPWAMAEFMKSTTKLSAFDFGPLGIALLSREALPTREGNALPNHILPPFLSYALSADLWGPNGKWTRFHERLHTQFDKLDLLKGASSPGRYVLKGEAQKLELKGIFGTPENGHYILTLPWTFSLTALLELERVLSQEF